MKFECKLGFVLKGSAVRKCLENGTWNGTETICKGKWTFKISKDLTSRLTADTNSTQCCSMRIASYYSCPLQYRVEMSVNAQHTNFKQIFSCR